MKRNSVPANPPSHRPMLTVARLDTVTFAVSCLVLVYFACSQSGLTQVSVAHDMSEQSNEMLPPLVDLGPGEAYNTEEGGLYPGGSNVRPAPHDAAGRRIARDIVPLDADGKPDPINGKIV